MKATVEISDDLAEAVRRLAAEENTTLRALIEASLWPSRPGMRASVFSNRR